MENKYYYIPMETDILIENKWICCGYESWETQSNGSSHGIVSKPHRHISQEIKILNAIVINKLVQCRPHLPPHKPNYRIKYVILIN